MNLDDLSSEPDADPDFDPDVCECELDWRCGLHRGQYTPLELMNDEWAKSEDPPWWAQ